MNIIQEVIMLTRLGTSIWICVGLNTYLYNFYYICISVCMGVCLRVYIICKFVLKSGNTLVENYLVLGSFIIVAVVLVLFK